MSKFCTNCGATLEDDAVFCPECGTRSAAAPEQPPVEEKVFCTNCGGKLDNIPTDVPNESGDSTNTAENAFKLMDDRLQAFRPRPMVVFIHRVRRNQRGRRAWLGFRQHPKSAVAVSHGRK